MQFRVFGVLEVIDDVGDPVALGSARERLVLAQLLLEADRVVPADRLIDLLWTEPPPTARQQVQNLLAGLRRRFAADTAPLISTRPLGYQLHLGDHDVDLLQFRRLVSQARLFLLRARLEEAVNLLDTARELWRGPPLHDVVPAATPAFEPTVQSLREERIAALDQLLDAWAALGRHERVLATSAAELEMDPWNERLHEHRLRALARTGRRSEAADAYRRLRREFIDELGVEPGTALADLNHEIIRDGESMHGQRESPSSIRTTPRELPANGWRLLGRDSLLEAVAHDVRTALDGACPTVTLVGASGVGKTAVAVAVGHHVATDFPDGTLYAALDDSHSEGEASHDVVGATLIRLLGTLGVPAAQIPTSNDARIALYRSLTTDRRLLVVIDGATSEKQVRPLLPSGPHCAALVSSHSMLGGLLGARRHTVGPLEPDDGLAVLVAVSGREGTQDRETLAVISQVCGHLPLALCVIGSRIATDSTLELRDLATRLTTEHGRLDELRAGDLSVSASIAAAVADVGDSSIRLFRRLAAAPSLDWPAWLASRLLGDDGCERRALDELTDRHLVIPSGRDGAGQARLAMHPLVRDHARERLLAEEGPEAANHLETQLAMDFVALAERAASRLDPPSVTPDAPVTESDGTPNPAECLPSDWFATERTNLRHSVHALVQRGEWDAGARGALSLAQFLAIRADDDERVEILHAVSDHYPATSDQRIVVDLLGALFAAHAQRQELAALTPITERLLEVGARLEDPAVQVRALSQAGWVARARSDHATAMTHFTDAAHLAEQIGDADALAHVRGQQGVVLRNLGRAEEADPLLAAVVDHARDHGSRRNLSIWLLTRAETLIDLEQWDRAAAVLREAQELADDLGDPLGQAHIALALARVALGRGDAGEASRLLARAVQVHPHRELTASLEMVLLRIDLLASTSDWEGARASAAEALEAGGDPSRLAALATRLAAILTELERPDESAVARTRAGEQLRRGGLPDTAARLPKWLYPAAGSAVPPMKRST